MLCAKIGVPGTLKTQPVEKHFQRCQGVPPLLLQSLSRGFGSLSWESREYVLRFLSLFISFSRKGLLMTNSVHEAQSQGRDDAARREGRL